MIDQQNAAPAEVLVRSDQIVTESLLSSTNGGASAVDSHSRLYNSGCKFPGTQQPRSHPLDLVPRQGVWVTTWT
jgi:hypothetical protein